MKPSTRLILSLCLVLGFTAFSCRSPEPEPKEPLKIPDASKASGEKPAEPTSPRDGVLQAIKHRGELRVGMQIGYVPFQMQGSGGQLEGLEVEAAELVARALKVNLRVVRLNWQDLIPSLLAGETDVVISGMSVTPERSLQVMFTVPVLETGRMFLVHRSNADRFKKLDDLDQPGVFIVSGPGGTGDLRLKHILPNAAYREFPDRTGALEEVLQQRAHAFIDEEVFVRLAISMNPDKLSCGFRLITYEPIAWAVKPGECHWLNWLDHFIRLIQKDGRLEELKKKWLRDYFLDMGSRSRKSGRPNE